ncbi:hypothetical protein LEP1GSC050_1879 [Leptospira broomii serovar Hurstbridge str. 5399]|uniref:Uncharacterized protein n=1 Tax=Leptospira broomii serovar Hurstbridge str. 5399 TaxID=1049789 RepID=T0F782_9LEPT|nr:hypothetical protein LEP1GSC050_1879 [Leptospira broomii serovar Hurstbridge str. 5399]
MLENTKRVPRENGAVFGCLGSDMKVYAKQTSRSKSRKRSKDNQWNGIGIFGPDFRQYPFFIDSPATIAIPTIIDRSISTLKLNPRKGVLIC